MSKICPSCGNDILKPEARTKNMGGKDVAITVYVCGECGHEFTQDEDEF